MKRVRRFAPVFVRVFVPVCQIMSTVNHTLPEAKAALKKDAAESESSI